MTASSSVGWHVACILIMLGALGCAQSRADEREESSPPVELPAPKQAHGVSLEQAIGRRRSVRDFSNDPLTDAERGQLLWAAQGVTDRAKGYRTAPSAGALYPLEIYLVTGSGVFHYEPEAHRLRPTMSGDARKALYDAALRQRPILEAPAVFVLTGVYERTAKKYGTRAARYVHMEAGHAAQNLLLQAVSLGLAAVPIGAFDDARVQQALGLPKGERPLYLVPAGHPVR